MLKKFGIVWNIYISLPLKICLDESCWIMVGEYHNKTLEFRIPYILHFNEYIEPCCIIISLQKKCNIEYETWELKTGQFVERSKI